MKQNNRNHQAQMMDRLNARIATALDTAFPSVEPQSITMVELKKALARRDSLAVGDLLMQLGGEEQIKVDQILKRIDREMTREN